MSGQEPWMTLQVPGWEPIEIVIDDLGGELGHYDPKTATIRIDRKVPPIGREIILVHELLHAAESACISSGAISKRVTHAFVENAAPILLALFAAAPPLRAITPTGVAAFMAREIRKDRRRRR